jgi:hypothetical protein
MIEEIVLSQAFITVVAGVLVYSISQYIMIKFVSPHQAYMKAASDLSKEMLSLTHKYSNYSLTDDEECRIKDANAAYLAAVWNMGSSKRKRKRIRENGFEVSQRINSIASLGHAKLDNGKRDLELIMGTRTIQSLDHNLLIEYTHPLDLKHIYPANKKHKKKDDSNNGKEA